MNKTILGSFLLTAIVLSDAGHAMSRDLQKNQNCSDALSALQQTQNSVLSDLQKTMRSGLSTRPQQRLQGFGIDDTGSYARQDDSSLTRAATEG